MKSQKGKRVSMHDCTPAQKNYTRSADTDGSHVKAQ